MTKFRMERLTVKWRRRPRRRETTDYLFYDVKPGQRKQRENY